MRIKHSFFTGMVLAAALALPLAAQELKPIELPKPQTTGGKPLMQALSERKSTRAFSPEALSPQMLSNLLWAGSGINRPSGHRTAPTARNLQEIEIYVVLPEGIYLWDYKGNILNPVLAGDHRALAGTQDFVKTAPLNLVYVADYAKYGGMPEAEANTWAGADTAFIAQNVYLFCASENLAVVVRGWVNREAFAKAASLKPQRKVILSQTVGYPKK